MSRARLAAALALLALTSSSTLDASFRFIPPPWDLRSLHREVRARVHLRVSEVPPFPGENPMLMDPHNWPAVMNVHGVRCALRIEAALHDMVGIRRKSVDDVGPHMGLNMFYEPIESMRRERAGPVYWWSSIPEHAPPSTRRQVFERYWVHPHRKDRTAIGYSYYRGTNLLRCYRVVTDSRRDAAGEPFEWFKEYFDRDGSLIAVGYAQLRPDGIRTQAFYRKGVPISYEEFERQVGIPPSYEGRGEAGILPR